MYQITSNMINDFISEKLKKYSEEYTKGLYKTLRVLFCFAHSRKYLKKNPFDNVTPPPDPRHIGDICHYEPNEISWSNAQAGDLAFYGDLSHVGIIAGKDTNGNILVIHCSASSNNVVITTNSGFGFAARPSVY